MQLSLFQKKRTFLKSSTEFYIDIETGETFAELPTFKATIIYDTQGKQYRESRSKPPEKYKYNKYKLKNGIWISTKERTTSFLGAVLQDKYGEAVALTMGDNYALCFLGQRKELIKGKSREELEERIDHFYQGIEYTVLPFSKASQEVFKEQDYGVVVLIGGIILLLFFGYMMFGGGEEEVTQVDTTVMQDISAPPPQPSPVELTNGMLEALYGVGLKQYQFVASVDFNRNAIIVYSLIPDAGFRKVGDVFQKMVELDISPVKPEKSFTTCLTYIKQYDITSVENDSISVEIHEQLPVEEVNALLKNLKGCPAEIRGTVKFADLLHRQVDIAITLYSSPPSS